MPLASLAVSENSYNEMGRWIPQLEAEGVKTDLQELPAISADLKSENDELFELGYGFTVQQVAERLSISVKAAQSIVRAVIKH